MDLTKYYIEKKWSNPSIFPFDGNSSPQAIEDRGRFRLWNVVEKGPDPLLGTAIDLDCLEISKEVYGKFETLLNSFIEKNKATFEKFRPENVWEGEVVEWGPDGKIIEPKYHGKDTVKCYMTRETVFHKGYTAKIDFFNYTEDFRGGVEVDIAVFLEMKANHDWYKREFYKLLVENMDSSLENYSYWKEEAREPLKLVVSEAQPFGGTDFTKYKDDIKKAQNEGHKICTVSYLHGTVENAMGYDICACLNAEEFVDFEKGQYKKDGIYDVEIKDYPNLCKAFLWNSDEGPCGLIVDSLDKDDINFASYRYNRKEML